MNLPVVIRRARVAEHGIEAAVTVQVGEAGILDFANLDSPRNRCTRPRLGRRPWTDPTRQTDRPVGRFFSADGRQKTGFAGRHPGFSRGAVERFG